MTGWATLIRATLTGCSVVPRRADGPGASAPQRLASTLPAPAATAPAGDRDDPSTHPTLPLPSYRRVHNPAKRDEAVLRINDRGPFHSRRIIDLSDAAAVKLGVQGGVAPVELECITFEDIRTGAWRRSADNTTALAQTTPANPPSAPPTPVAPAPAVETPAEAAAGSTLPAPDVSQAC